MAEMGDVQIRLRVKDEVTPKLRRIGWALWWFEHRDAAILALWTLVTFISGLVAGRVL